MFKSHGRPSSLGSKICGHGGPTVFSFYLTEMPTGWSGNRDNTADGLLRPRGIQSKCSAQRGQRGRGGLLGSEPKSQTKLQFDYESLWIYCVYQWKASKQAIPRLLAYLLVCCLELGTSFPMETILQIVALPSRPGTKVYGTLMYLNTALILLKTLTDICNSISVGKCI